MLIGVGTDTVEIDRIKIAIQKTGIRFIQRVFTAEEENYCESKKDKYASYAVRFAGKEAVFKALGTGISGCKWTDVEIISKENGRPEVLLHGQAAQTAREKNITGILISLSHDRTRAVAFAAAVTKEGD
ncbi:holo-ACP synthase [Desulfolucanica intricata]|uniref:holo-ACP synthase n=1 Tax=Desulfolucanica intricata TaxID=1285191 RepID=UPI00082DDF29|nr:holo-ACP synthase [Desulfolucanica intricata]